MDNDIKKMDWESYKNLYNLKEHPTVRTFHWSPLFNKTNGEYIFQPQALADRVDEGFLGGEGAYGSSLSKAGQLYASGNMGMNDAPKLFRPEVIGYDVPYEQFIDISKPLNQQPEYIQKAVQAYRNSGKAFIDNTLETKDFWDIEGNLKKLPKITNASAWNSVMDELYPYGVLGVYDRNGLAGENYTYAYRHVKDMPKGYSAGRGVEIEPNIAPELFGNTPDSIEHIKWSNKMNGVRLPAIEEKYVKPVSIYNHIKETVPNNIYSYYKDKAENLLSNTISDENLKMLSRGEIKDEIDILASELIMDDYMKVHPEGIEIYKNEPIINKKSIISPEQQAEFSKIIDDALKEETPKLSTPAKSIAKQTPVVKPKVVSQIPKVNIQPQVIKPQPTTKTLGQIGISLINKGTAMLKNPNTYKNLGRGFLEGLLIEEALRRSFINPWQAMNNP
ncbi:MAG: hypothetical protein IIT65_00765, partial [Lachnospiraceae bacterium]|nr:hypothetical protein [Lachnospiraceae bacterium]